jgi:hypothetical protein
MTTPHPDLGAFFTQRDGTASVPVIKKNNCLVRLFSRLRAWLVPFGSVRPHAEEGRRVRQCGGEECLASESTSRCFGAKAKALKKAGCGAGGAPPFWLPPFL